MISKLLVAALLIAAVVGQQVGTQTAENHPSLSFSHCTKSGCTSTQGSAVLDSNWRWTHTTTGTTNCYTGNQWDTSICPDPVTCAQKCALDGADYQGTYGVTSSGGALTLGFVTHGPYSTNIGSRLYLLASSSKYQMFQLVNQEFAFDVDVSQLPCGLNGALYFVSMDADGGMSKYTNNKCGANYGTGYCDAQCPHDMKFINGEANILNWKPEPNNPNSGTGQYGTCCTEMDVWEANSMSTAYTPHVCSVQGQYRCSGTQCGDIPNNRYGGVCDKDGCDFNPYRLGNPNFYGAGKTVDTSKPFTVVTQWVGSPVTEINQFFVQNGKVIPRPPVAVSGVKPYQNITDQFCTDIKTKFGDKNQFESIGGLKSLNSALSTGMVLVMSLWDDYYAQMLWLDSTYPTNGSTTPGMGPARGPCPTTSGVPSQVESQYPNAKVTFSNIKYGDIGTTYAHN